MDLETRARRATDEMLRMPRDLDARLADLYRTRRRRALGKAAAASIVVVLALAGVLVGRDIAQGPEPAGIPVPGHNPSGEGFGFGSIWVTSFGSNNHPRAPGYVARYDPATRRLVKLIQVGGGPFAAEPGFGSMWVSNGWGGTVTRIDPATNAVLATIKVGPFPYQMAAAGGGLWVATQNAADKIDPTTDKVVARAPYPRPPHTQAASGPGFALDANAQGVWVSTAYGTVLRFRPSDGRLVATIPVLRVQSSQPGSVVIQGNNVWVSNYPVTQAHGPGGGADTYGPQNHLTEISATTDKIIRRVQSGGYPVLGFLPHGRTLFLIGTDSANKTSELIRTDWPYQLETYAHRIAGNSWGIVFSHGTLWTPSWNTHQLQTFNASDGVPNTTNPGG
jgi:YVTN family beta-propeller protein